MSDSDLSVSNLEDLDFVLGLFSEELEDLLGVDKIEDPLPNEFADLIVKYHIQVAPYIAKHQKPLHKVLRQWSTSILDDEEAQFFVEILTKGENGSALGYLWCAGLGELETELVARKLSEQEGYNYEYLPPILNGYYPREDSERKLS